MDAAAGGRGVTVRAITDLATLRAIEDLQVRVWGMPERDVVPAHQLLAAASAGGVVLGAFTPTGELIGFCYGFVGRREGRYFFYSHMAGVLEPWRDRHVGFHLKRVQREAALARGLDRMVWTFDPLQSTNAYFNLHRLGGQAGRYLVNYYGEMPDELNRGVESDRLEVDWLLRERRVQELMEADPPPSVSPPPDPRAVVVLTGSGDPFPQPGDALLDVDAPEVWLGIPEDFSALRRADLPLAQQWRAASRQAFQTYFGRGYPAVDFVRAPALGYYILRRPRAD